MEPALMLSVLLLLGCISAHAGEQSPLDLKQVAPHAPVSLDEPWKFTLGVPGWLPGIYGDIGINGITTPVKVNFRQILPYVNFVTSVGGRSSKGQVRLRRQSSLLEHALARRPEGSFSRKLIFAWMNTSLTLA